MFRNSGIWWIKISLQLVWSHNENTSTLIRNSYYWIFFRSAIVKICYTKIFSINEWHKKIFHSKDHRVKICLLITNSNISKETEFIASTGNTFHMEGIDTHFKFLNSFSYKRYSNSRISLSIDRSIHSGILFTFFLSTGRVFPCTHFTRSTELNEEPLVDYQSSNFPFWRIPHQ